MALQNLTSLATFKSWAAIPDNSSDLLLTRLISRVSQAILTYMNRDTILLQSYTEYRDPTGSCRMTLRNYPVQSVQSLNIWNSSIPAVTAPGSSSNSTGNGFFLTPGNAFPPGGPQQLILYGYTFCAPPSGIVVTYKAGYGVTGEPQTVPATSPYVLRVSEPYGRFAADGGVTYASTKVALTAKNTAVGLSVGQYYVDPNQGLYYFAAADANVAMLITYSYVPADLEQACLEWMMDRFKYKDRVGEKSKSLGGQETISFDVNDMPKIVKGMLASYRKLIL